MGSQLQKNTQSVTICLRFLNGNSFLKMSYGSLFTTETFFRNIQVSPGQPRQVQKKLFVSVCSLTLPYVLCFRGIHNGNLSSLEDMGSPYLHLFFKITRYKLFTDSFIYWKFFLIVIITLTYYIDHCVLTIYKALSANIHFYEHSKCLEVINHRIYILTVILLYSK